SAALLLDLLLAGAVACTCPVLLAAAIPRAVAVVSGLAQRPRSGLALDSADSVEIIGSEEGEPGRLCVDVDRAPLPVVVSWGHRRPWRPVEATHNCQAPGNGEPLHLPRSRPRRPGQASSAAGCRALYAPQRGAHCGVSGLL